MVRPSSRRRINGEEGKISNTKASIDDQTRGDHVGVDGTKDAAGLVGAAHAHHAARTGSSTLTQLPTATDHPKVGE